MKRNRPLSLAFTFLAVGLLVSCTGPAQPREPYKISETAIRNHHQALYDIATKAEGLDAGVRLNEAGDKAAQYLLQGFKDAGLQNARFEEFYPLRWWPEKYELIALTGSDAAGKKLTAFPLWYCEGVKDKEFELVYVGYGTPGEWLDVDVEGKAVLMDMKRILHFIPSYNYTMGKNLALSNGAAALIIADTLIDSPSGNPIGDGGKIKDQKGIDPKLYPLPTLSIGKSDGDFLRNAVKAGPTKVRINLEYTMTEGRTVNVVGELPGNGKIDEYIIVGGHYDTWFQGAVDNHGSQASMLEMAKYFAKMPQAERNRHLIFVSLFGHEFGNAAMGHAAFVEKHADIKEKVTCFLNIDGSGSWGYEEKDNTGEIYPTNKDDKSGIFATSWPLVGIAEESTYGLAKGPWGQYPINSMVADLGGPLFEAGWPCLLIISKHIYYHTMLDTMEKITPDQVYRRTLMNISIINRLLNSPPGYLIAVDGNPNRQREVKEIADVSIQVIPDTIREGSMVMAWPGYF
ncbi:MAG: M28 family peptidase, partial [Chloroflexi bacterium]|nr:M28 family peptidase [Chloroflexota bacterium]